MPLGGGWLEIYLSRFGLFKTLVHFKVKNCCRMLSWHDVWRSDRPLKNQFLYLFTMTCLKDATVQEVIAIGTYLV